MGNKSIKKILGFFLLTALIVFGYFIFTVSKTDFAKAGSSENISGWAWSETIGWISFNSLNCDADEDGLSEGSPPDCPAAGSPVANYGVNVDTITGLFSGYAWSNGIGWVSFNTADLVGCPSGVCEARLNTTTFEVLGWARALAPVGRPLSETGGWDGWIQLRGTALDGSSYGVSLNTGISPKEFEGWAWGGDDTPEEAIVGWVSFNCSNQGVCASSDYKVATDFNVTPTASSLSIDGQAYCSVAAGVGTVFFSWTYSDPDSDPETRFQFRVDDDPLFLSPEVDRDFIGLSNPSPTVNNQQVFVRQSPIGDDIAYGTTYYWQVRVYDDDGNNSGWVAAAGPFTTTAHAWPSPSFTFVPLSPSEGEVITFTNTTTFYDIICGGDPDNIACSYLWDFGDATTSTLREPSHTYTDFGSYDITLTATDSDGFVCTLDPPVSLVVAFPLPVWREIQPL